MNVKGACQLCRAARAVRGVRKTHGKRQVTSFPAGTPPDNTILDGSLAIFLSPLDDRKIAAHIRPGNVLP
jgi:hypothetical protein